METIGNYLKLSETIGNCLGSSRYFGSSWDIWAPLGIFGLLLGYLGSSWDIWDLLGILGIPLGMWDLGILDFGILGIWDLGNLGFWEFREFVTLRI